MCVRVSGLSKYHRTNLFFHPPSLSPLSSSWCCVPAPSIGRLRPAVIVKRDTIHELSVLYHQWSNSATQSTSPHVFRFDPKSSPHHPLPRLTINCRSITSRISGIRWFGSFLLRVFAPLSFKWSIFKPFFRGQSLLAFRRGKPVYYCCCNTVPRCTWPVPPGDSVTSSNGDGNFIHPMSKHTHNVKIKTKQSRHTTSYIHDVFA